MRCCTRDTCYMFHILMCSTNSQLMIIDSLTMIYRLFDPHACCSAQTHAIQHAILSKTISMTHSTIPRFGRAIGWLVALAETGGPVTMKTLMVVSLRWRQPWTTHSKSCMLRARGVLKYLSKC